MLRNQQTGRVNRYIGIGICVVLGMAFGTYHNQAVRHRKTDVVIATVRTLTTPVSRATVATGRFFNRQVGWLFHGRTMADENRRLKEQNARLTEEVSRLREASATVQRLRDMLGFQSKPPLNKVPAEVIALRPNPNFETIVISRGSRDGIHINSVVVSPYGLVGSVYDVGPTSASVLMLTDSNSAVGAMVQRPESRATGVCKGNGSPMLMLAYLSRDADIIVGDTIISSGLGGDKGVFPKGLVIGTVNSVAKDVSGFSRRVVVKPSVDFNKLEEVYVLQ